jgi:Putative bacterial sensory transduction regulator
MRCPWIFALPLLLPIAAQAGPLPDGGVTVQEVARALQDKGFQTEITTDKDGDPLIKSKLEGAKFSVYFYECGGRPRCKSIQFAAGFAMKGEFEATQAQQWNRTKRFGRVYQDDESDPWVEMDMDVEHGATTDALTNDVDRWVVVLNEFRKYIGR